MNNILTRNLKIAGEIAKYMHFWLERKERKEGRKENGLPLNEPSLPHTKLLLIPCFLHNRIVTNY